MLIPKTHWSLKVRVFLSILFIVFLLVVCASRFLTCCLMSICYIHFQILQSSVALFMCLYFSFSVVSFTSSSFLLNARPTFLVNGLFFVMRAFSAMVILPLLAVSIFSDHTSQILELFHLLSFWCIFDLCPHLQDMHISLVIFTFIFIPLSSVTQSAGAQYSTHVKAYVFLGSFRLFNRNDDGLCKFIVPFI